MQLNKKVVYRKINNYCLILNCCTEDKFLFNETSYDIIKTIDENNVIEFDDLLNILLQTYDVDDVNSFKNDIQEFVDYLIEQNIIIKNYTSENNNEFSELNVQNYLGHVYFELTHNCNFKCSHCYLLNENKYLNEELKFEDYKIILEKLKKMGVLEVTFTGGEITVKKDFLKIIEYANELGFAIHLYSNGYLFDDELIYKLSKMNIISYSSSLYGSNAEVHESISLKPGSFQKTLDTLIKFKCLGIKTIVKTIIMKPTEHDFENLLKLIKMYNFNLETSLQYLVANENDNRGSIYRVNDTEKYKKYLKLQIEYLDIKIEEKKCRGNYICGLGKTLNIDPYGNIFPCNVLLTKLGNIKFDDIEEIWNNSKKLKTLQQINKMNLSVKCQNCENFEFCLFCPGANKRENGDIKKYTCESCNIAEAKKSIYEIYMKGGECNEKI